MSLAAVPVYLLVRRLGGGTWPALAGAALTVASPDLFFSSFVLADAVAYPLVLGAVYLGVCALSQPSRRAQLGFTALALLATFARIQYVFLPLVFLAAAFVVERGSLRSVARRFRLTILLYAAPLGIAAGLGPSRLLGYYSGLADLGVKPLALGHWLGTDALLLAYAAGFALVPGALAGLAVRARAAAHAGGERLRGLRVGVLRRDLRRGGPLRVERLRPLPGALPDGAAAARLPRLLAVDATRPPGRAHRRAGSLGLIALAARVPLSGYTISDAKQDSPFLLAVFRLEKAVGIGTGSLVVAIGRQRARAARARRLLPARVRAGCRRRGDRRGGVASVGAVAFDSHVVRGVQTTMLAPDAQWVDHSGLRRRDARRDACDPARRRARAALLERVLEADLLPRRRLRDRRLRLAEDPRRLGRPPGLRPEDPAADRCSSPSTACARRWPTRPSSTARRTTPSGARRAPPRFALFTGGLYHDGWLATGGHITVYPAADGLVRGVAALTVSLPPKPRAERTVLQLSGPGMTRRVVVLPGQASS